MHLNRSEDRPCVYVRYRYINHNNLEVYLSLYRSPDYSCIVFVQAVPDLGHMRPCAS